jgi:hypothetical protein
VTLVSVRVRNDASVARRVRVRNVLDGPTLPPREAGVPERGWSGDRFECVVPAGGERALGYACPAPQGDDPPVVVESLGRASTEPDASDDPGTDAAAAVRMLGRARPPAEAVPTEEADPVGSAATAAPASQGEAPVATESDGQTDDCTSDVLPGVVRADDRPSEAPAAAARGTTAPTPSPASGADAVWTWLIRVERRVRRAERLTGASAAEATAVLAEAGGYAGVASLPARVDADEAALRAVAERAETLADRAADADAAGAVESLEGLA